MRREAGAQDIDPSSLIAPYQHGRHFSQTLDFACALRTQNQGFEKNGEGIAYQLPFISTVAKAGDKAEVAYFALAATEIKNAID